MTARYEMRRAILFSDVCQFKDNAHHSRMDSSIIEAIAEDWISLLRSTAVKSTMFLSFFTPDREGIFHPDIGSDNFV